MKRDSRKIGHKTNSKSQPAEKKQVGTEGPERHSSLLELCADRYDKESSFDRILAEQDAMLREAGLFAANSINELQEAVASKILKLHPDDGLTPTPIIKKASANIGSVFRLLCEYERGFLLDELPFEKLDKLLPEGLDDSQKKNSGGLAHEISKKSLMGELLKRVLTNGWKASENSEGIAVVFSGSLHYLWHIVHSLTEFRGLKTHPFRILDLDLSLDLARKLKEETREYPETAAEHFRNKCRGEQLADSIQWLRIRNPNAPNAIGANNVDWVIAQLEQKKELRSLQDRPANKPILSEDAANGTEDGRQKATGNEVTLDFRGSGKASIIINDKEELVGSEQSRNALCFIARHGSAKGTQLTGRGKRGGAWYSQESSVSRSLKNLAGTGGVLEGILRLPGKGYGEGYRFIAGARFIFDSVDEANQANSDC